MARAVWSGSLTFGLVTLPVQLATATDSHTIRFRQLERGTSDRVRNRRVNERTGEEVPYDKIVKGYDTGGGEYVIIEPGELDEITPGRSQAIEITGFVELDAIAPAYFDSTYFLQPRKEHANVYGLLRDALAETGRAGIATMSMRQKDYLVAVHEQGGVLVMHTLHWADEVRDPHETLSNLPSSAKAPARERKMATQLIEAMAMEWNPYDYHDRTQERVRELVEAKRSGERVPKAEGPPESTNVVDLMSALEASVDEARSSRTRRGAGGRSAKAAKSAGGARSGKQRPTSRTGGGSRAGTAKKQAGGRKQRERDLAALTKDELYRLAGEADVPGRSRMTRAELEEAVARSSSRAA
ncbi:Ku protein [Streptomyces sp. Amel2xB2]|uniref:non-homologous end joining protein Ku n=1 Tax=Streptomyces sp. Amel2xB2 TaxID=1305829 RepID=UPI000DB98CCC|nr:Ku protein [Streptomyces sp. Amel2xB2]RAJ71331.1 Ku protein [Streptomyces sp. Amel2xB2]